jgi:hypothetical protein
MYHGIPMAHGKIQIKILHTVVEERGSKLILNYAKDIKLC